MIKQWLSFRNITFIIFLIIFILYAIRIIEFNPRLLPIIMLVSVYLLTCKNWMIFSKENRENFSTTLGTISIPANLIVTGNITTTNGNITATNGNITATTGNIETTGNIKAKDIEATGNIKATTGNITATRGNITATSTTGNIIANGYIEASIVKATFLTVENIQAFYNNMEQVYKKINIKHPVIFENDCTMINGKNFNSTGNITANGNITATDITANGNIKATNITATDITANGNIKANGNITATMGNITRDLTVTGKITAKDIEATDNIKCQKLTVYTLDGTANHITTDGVRTTTNIIRMTEGLKIQNTAGKIRVAYDGHTHFNFLRSDFNDNIAIHHKEYKDKDGIRNTLEIAGPVVQIYGGNTHSVFTYDRVSFWTNVHFERDVKFVQNCELFAGNKFTFNKGAFLKFIGKDINPNTPMDELADSDGTIGCNIHGQPGLNIVGVGKRRRTYVWGDVNILHGDLNTSVVNTSVVNTHDLVVDTLKGRAWKDNLINHIRLEDNLVFRYDNTSTLINSSQLNQHVLSRHVAGR